MRCGPFNVAARADDIFISNAGAARSSGVPGRVTRTHLLKAPSSIGNHRSFGFLPIRFTMRSGTVPPGKQPWRSDGLSELHHED